MAAGTRVGSQFGQYHLRALLGRGGMGEVYEAYDTTKDRTVALKILDVDLAKDPTYQQRFRRESHAAARLQEPHVIPIHDWGEIDGVLYIDMRLVVGQDLRSLLRTRGPMGPAHAVAIVDQIAAALDAAHTDGLIHRDVKPENILVTAGEFAYLVDFGIVHSSSDLRLTTLGSAVGSYAYMAPERFDNAPVDARADVYSLACVLYECLTGSIPFPSNSISSAIRAHLTTPVPSPSSIRPDVPAAFEEVIARGLAKDPRDRYPTAGDFAAAARSALTARERRTEPDIATRPEPSSGMRSEPTRVDDRGRPPVYPPTAFHGEPPAQPPAAPYYPSTPYAPPARRSVALPVTVTVLVIALLVLGGVVGWLVLDRNTPDASTVAAATSSQVRASATEDVPAASAAPATVPPAVTTPRTTTAPPPTIVGEVSGSDRQGFLAPSDARCNYTNPAVFIGRTTKSLVVVCETGVGRYYYQGVRISDGAAISVDDPISSGTGFVATGDGGTQYRLTPSALTIVSGDGRILATEPMVESAHR
ncbi:serine/threonine-protein kinase [Rhodococcus percolatus]|uniref:serine/threonine-protein kinase n=1 Tax=Rhodococcus opacus TaxID=37919 RepID=UPI0015FAD801|nr:serine/threonine-protein kinase [Rhodococcus opacus]MBA8959128.1 serine/threonine-protein kinase [Rhodococcus opacus]MBP2204693.1 serine/threonine-protein kinase [Rhodococcus opacus]